MHLRHSQHLLTLKLGFYLLSDQTLSVKFSWKLSRLSNNPEMVGTVHKDRSVALPPFEGGVRSSKREQLAAMLRSNMSLSPVVIPNIFPKFLKITNKGDADPISKFMEGSKDNCKFFFTTLPNLSRSGM